MCVWVAVGCVVLGEWLVGVVLYMCVLLVWIPCGDGRYMCIVLGGHLPILGAPSVKSCYTLSISAS